MHDSYEKIRARVVRSSIAAAVIAAAAIVVAAQESPEPQPPVYDLHLVYIFDGPETEFVFVVGNSGFRTVDSLKAFVSSLRPGTTLRWSPGCVRMGGEPLLSSESEMEEFRAFCLEHKVDFVLIPSG